MALFRPHATQSAQSPRTFEFCSMASPIGLQFPNDPYCARLEQDDRLVRRSNARPHSGKQMGHLPIVRPRYVTTG